MSLLKHIRRFVVGREHHQSEFIEMNAETIHPAIHLDINAQDLVRYEVALFTTACEFIGDTATATSQRKYARENAVRELRHLMYGGVEDQLRKMQRDILKGALRGSYSISKRIDEIVEGLGE